MLLLRSPSVPTTKVRENALGIETDGLGAVHKSFVELVLSKPGGAAVALGLTRTRIEADGFTLVDDRFVELTFLGPGEAAAEMGASVIRIKP